MGNAYNGVSVGRMKKALAETIDVCVKLTVGVIVLAVMCVYRLWEFVFRRKPIVHK